MKQTLHRLFCLLLCAVMVVGMIPATASAAQNEPQQLEASMEGYMVTVAENGRRTYTPTTFEKEQTLSLPAQNEATISFPSKKEIVEDGSNYIEFTTFADLKALTERYFPEWTSIHYIGEEDLEITESLIIPDCLDFYVQRGADLIIPAGVTLTVNGDIQVFGGGALTVKGSLVLNGYAAFDGDVTITGSVTAYGTVRLAHGKTHVGLEKLQFANPYGRFTYDYDAASFAEVKEALAAAKADPANFYDIYMHNSEDIVVSSNLTVPENARFSSWSSAQTITVNAGITLTVNGQMDFCQNAFINGNLVNNGTINFYGNNYNTVLTFGSGSSYSGTGVLQIHVNEEDTNYTPYVSGLKTSEMERTEFQDQWEHYWKIRDLSSLTKLGTPSSLAWNKAEKYVYDETTDQWTQKEETFYGAIRFKPSKIVDTENGYTPYRITLYRNGKQFYSTTYSYNNDYLKRGEYIYEYPVFHADLTSGTYYFTVQAIARSSGYIDGPVNTSKEWTYTKPDSRYARPTAAKWINNFLATWTNSGTEHYGAKVELYYAPTKTAEPRLMHWSWGEDMIGYELEQWDLEPNGTGYYYFKVRNLSDNITKKYHSAWTELSPAFHYTGDEKPVKPVVESWVNITGVPSIQWERSPGANKYEVYRATSKDGTYKKLATVGDDYYQQWYGHEDTTATVGKTYYYKVRAVGYNGIKSYFSSPISVRCLLATPVPTISNDASTGKPVVKWETVEGASKYYIYRSTTKTGEYKKVSTAISARSYKDTDATAGKVYYYYVVAVHEKSAYNSNGLVVYTRCDLKRPVVTISNSTSGYPYLKWSEISGAKEYEIYRATSKSGEYKKIGTTTALKYTDKKATAGKTYYYKVKAIHSNSGANSAFSAIDSIKAK